MASLLLAVGLTACSSDSDSSATAEPEASQQQDTGAPGATDAQDGDSTGEVDQECMEAVAAFRLIVPALKLRAEQGPLAAEDLTSTLGDFEPYAGNLDADVKADYDDFHAAVEETIGLEGDAAAAALDSAAVTEPLKGLTTMSLTGACMG